jgi:hypothetical protein
MKLYKLWLEIEELDTSSGEYRNLVENGVAEPVPVAVFRSLEQARAFAEAVAMDRSIPRYPWLESRRTVN